MSVVVRWFLVVQRLEPAQIFVAVQSPEVVQTAEVDFDSVQLSGGTRLRVARRRRDAARAVSDLL